MDGATQPVTRIPAGLEPLIQELYATTEGEALGISCLEFTGFLNEIVGKYLPAGAPADEVRALCLTLRVGEIVLCRACAAGNEKAWETFLTRYREKLYDMAYRIAREESAARDLADSLYGDLYGTITRDSVRVSKLITYTGRGSLEGWLRTIMAQEYVNRFRKQRRFTSMEEQTEKGKQFASVDSDPKPGAVDRRLEEATDEALKALSAEDRFILAGYHLDDHTLAEIAAVMRVHESTISRRLEKLTTSLRKAILAGLTRRGMSRRQAEEALETDVRDLGVDVRKRLAQETESPTFSRRSVRPQTDRPN
jgi:RNA polymerase sigma-70 factor (ECF subfamily)